MEDVISTGLLAGRPHGGVSIAWSPDLNHVITPVANYRHKRVVAVELETVNEKFLLISIYMPFYDASNRDVCLAGTVDALSFIELLIDDHPQHQVVIGGDLNSELKDNSAFDPLWRELATKKQLAYCSGLFTTPGYTYHHASLGHKKMNDHFIVSQSILNSGLTKNHKIIEDGANLSDHLPIMMQISVEIPFHRTTMKSNVSQPELKWNKLTDAETRHYSARLSQVTDEVVYTRRRQQCAGGCHCSDETCRYFIQQDYDDIVQCLKIADSSLPRHRAGTKKDWWSEELTDLKRQSIEIQTLWLAQGRPNQGPIHIERLRVRAAFRRAIRAAQRAPKQASWDKLHSALEQNDTNDFWNSWRTLYNKKNSRFAPVVDGCSGKEDIADTFKKSFERNSVPNNQEKVDELNARFSTKYRELNESHSSTCNCDDYHITNEHVMDAICSLKAGKSSDEDGVSAEHFHHAPFNLLERLTKLFNRMLLHSFVPTQFRLGFMIPIVKDNQGNIGDVSNYRGITISPISSKIFELILKSIFAKHLTTTPYQFGFKRKNSTIHALYCLKQTVSYYVNNGSRVYCSFLDASKAFDRLVHSGLFLKLIERKAPKIFLDIIITWYDGLYCRVQWDGHYSEWFHVSAGVRQGGILSPDFYSIYVDDLVGILQSSGVGCYIANTFAALLMYADDMAVLSPSLKGLNKLLHLCEEYCLEWDIGLNAQKSKNLMFGKGASPSFSPKLGGREIEWVEKWKYLGVTLRRGPRFGCCIEETVRKFYRAANSILRIDGKSDDLVMLRLLETHCVSILSYAVEVIVTNKRERQKMRVAYNSIFRKLFAYTWRQSVTNLQHELGRQNWEELVETRTNQFITKTVRFPSESLIRVLTHGYPCTG